MSKLIEQKKGFGTVPVFLTAISTILGAVMFLRFGYAVGSISFYGTVFIVIIGHLVTIPTALAIAEIATNQKVEGGGEYYIISRSFGINIGAAIGIALYFSRAISIAFYVIAFAEAFEPVFEWINSEFGFSLSDKRIISLPAMLILILIMLRKGANLGMKALYIVVIILFVSLVLFFMGQTDYSADSSFVYLSQTVENPDDFFYVFAIIFPAFTGMAAGVGLSGDLKDPKKSIPIGTVAATITGMVIYIFIAFKLSRSASSADLVNDQLIMSDIALWGPIIPIGLAAATISSALGSIIVAPRILQALGQDKVFQVKQANDFLGAERARDKEPINALIITSIIALFFVLIGDVNFVAEIISMFFMVSYGSICMISFLHHFAGDPSYRPSFRSKGVISMVGAVACLYLMLKMNFTYAVLALATMTLFYLIISATNGNRKGLAKIFQGVIFQVSRKLQIFLQNTEKEEVEGWRPSVICISETFFQRPSAFNMLRWISHKYGFGTYLHYVNGYLSKESIESSKKEYEEILALSSSTRSNVFIDTMISPSYTSAIAQAMQMPSISGKEFNMILFEYPKGEEKVPTRITENFSLVKAANFDVGVLLTSERDFGFRKRIDIWITKSDYENSNLMILMAYIIMGHPEWKSARINIFAIFPEDDIERERKNLTELAQQGRLPISAKNIEVIEKKEEFSNRDIINSKSRYADLTIVGFRSEAIKQLEGEIFAGYEEIGNTLFLNASKSKLIV
ncbi:MAG: amino acid permease [Cytophagales bacterium]|nr:amino acid permease [Cytophagales bacterium]